MHIFDQDIKYLKGVGPARAKLLGEELKVFTLEDLLYTFPYKYIDRTVVHRIAQLQEDMPYVQLKGQIVSIDVEGEGRRQRLKAVFTDGSGWVDLVWFNGIKAFRNSLRVDKTYLLLGKPTAFNGRFSIVHPELEVIDPAVPAAATPTATLQPHYHTTEKMKRQALTSRVVAELVRNAFALLSDRIEETLPDYLIKEYNLAPLASALRIIHFPTSADELPAIRRRLKFEELFYLQLDILRYAQNRRNNYAGFVFPTIGETFHTFYNERLPFALTNAQKRVIREIRRDMAGGKQMNRLIQGDVGSGKTMVALMACLMAIDNGFQGCLMAPTEILAEQHLTTLREFLGPMAVNVELLTGSVTGKRRTDVLQRTAEGDVHILVGTHALIEDAVAFHNLGLAVIDEQHRFGVKQRARIWGKNTRPPHILVMTATPIPRTLAMTLYGDLDVSVIDELPPGRKPIQTLHYTSNDLPQLYDGMRHELRKGRQIYVVYPLIEESEKTDLLDLEQGFDTMKSVFSEYHVGRIHGKMKPAEKEETMRAFANNETQILVSTTVIEVGVNVPNATVMVIQNADRFGLAQLHQLRGRVGRGGGQSYCLLITTNRLGETTQRRMQIMTETTDGFEIAEEDMRLRGPGDIEGTAQSGIPFELKIANIVHDAELMTIAREAAQNILKQDPYNCLSQNIIVWQRLKALKKQQINFSAIS